MIILGIESSCDDTSVALLNCSSRGCFVIKEITASQIEIHKKYGGVVPEVAGRMHAEKIVPLIEEVLKDEKEKTKKVHLDAIAVTSGPGLITGLIVGVETARALSYTLNVPLISINHLEGHIYSSEIKSSKKEMISYPALALIASGGHTEIILIKKQGQYKLIGKTKDDAAGECFDKVAKLLNLPYPGGPMISKLAKKGNPQAIILPRPMLKENNFDFSFSGLKTACLYYLQKNPITNEENLNDFCASFEQAIIDVLVGKTLKAVKKFSPKTLVLGGGVSANEKLRTTLETEISKIGKIKIKYPEIKYCMDNASMIALAGYYKAKNKKFTSWKKIKADPNWGLTKE